MSAVEFALLLPLMLMLYAGCVETTTALSLDRKVSRCASTIADLVAEETTISSAEMSDIFDATAAILEPNNPASASIDLLVIQISGSSQTIAWSAQRNGTTYANGAASPVEVPASYAIDGSEVVVGRVSYPYRSPFNALLTLLFPEGSLQLSHVFYLTPRQGGVITWQ
ncbi:TadE/TadG family type IV pilus assembly protein [Oryzibacter oryziterrae]|uniref:TadE/TadG family type IV pilus assembly protein n=1 Tax=Oryzibacter oryziterrae TaxID=2766474 RepID=UPI001F2486A4|nr:TadE/TadG family type IV pilus assembly protein [Oryzibacter oryziterrae]